MQPHAEYVRPRYPARRAHGWLAALAGLAAALVVLAAPPLELFDLHGKPVDPFAQEAAASVFVFTRTDCPISNRYAPELKRIGEAFSDRGVRFVLVYPDPDETAEMIAAHLDDYAYPFEALRDPRHALVALTDAHVTPEAAVFDRAGQHVYSGRIDDLYVDFGKRRPTPTKRDLTEALAATLAGRPVAEARTTAVGCFIAPLE
jgi:hypothetical protein